MKATIATRSQRGLSRSMTHIGPEMSGANRRMEAHVTVQRVLATVVLSANLINRTAMAEQLLEAVRASDPSAGKYSIEADSEAGSLVPQKDEDWGFTIVVELRAAENLVLSSFMSIPPSRPEGSDG